MTLVNVLYLVAACVALNVLLLLVIATFLVIGMVRR